MQVRVAEKKCFLFFSDLVFAIVSLRDNDENFPSRKFHLIYCSFHGNFVSFRKCRKMMAKACKSSGDIQVFIMLLLTKFTEDLIAVRYTIMDRHQAVTT